jgi:hypothetical protein
MTTADHAFLEARMMQVKMEKTARVPTCGRAEQAGSMGEMGVVWCGWGQQGPGTRQHTGAATHAMQACQRQEEVQGGGQVQAQAQATRRQGEDCLEHAAAALVGALVKVQAAVPPGQLQGRGRGRAALAGGKVYVYVWCGRAAAHCR